MALVLFGRVSDAGLLSYFLFGRSIPHLAMELLLRSFLTKRLIKVTKFMCQWIYGTSA